MLTRQRTFQISFLIGVVLLAPSFGKSVSGRHSEKLSIDEGGIEKKEAHPEVTPLLKSTDTQLMSTLFSWPPKLVEERFGAALPSALKSLSDDKLDSKQISKILSQFFRTTNAQQVQSIIATVSELQKVRDSSGSETQINSTSALLAEKLVDAGNWLLSKNTGKNTPERKTFLSNFKKDWNDSLKENKDLIAKRDQALDPNTSEESRQSAQKWLRDNVNRDQIMSFIAGQLANGKEQDAVKWFKSMAWRVGDQLVADLKNNGSPVTFYAGASEKEIADGLKAYEKEVGNKGSKPGSGFFNVAFNQFRHDVPATEFYLRNGQIVEGRPNGVPAPSVRQNQTAFVSDSQNVVPPSDTAQQQAPRRVRTVQ